MEIGTFLISMKNPLCAAYIGIGGMRIEKEPLWGLRNMTKTWVYDIMTMGLIYPLSEHVDNFPVRLVPTFH